MVDELIGALILELRYVEKWSDEEIAKVLECIHNNKAVERAFVALLERMIQLEVERNGQ